MAFTNRTAWLLVCAILLGFASCTAQAGYANPSPPSGWGRTGAGEYRAPAPATGAINPGWRGPGAVLNVGGRAVTLPAYYRVSANAARYAARAFLGPLGLTVAAAAWLASECFEKQGGSWVRTCGPGVEGFSGNRYRGVYSGFVGCIVAGSPACTEANTMGSAPPYPNQTGMVNAVIAAMAASPGDGCNINVCTQGVGQCIAITALGLSCYRYVEIELVTGTGGGAPVPATNQQVEDGMAPTTVPDTVLRELPDGVPVARPIINPSAGADPVAQPLSVPMGRPVAVPGTDPQEYEQPIAEVEPAPTDNEPWRVDVDVTDVTTTDPEGQEDPETVTDETPRDEEKDQCKLNPLSSACQELNTPAGDELPTNEIPVAVAPMGGWGADNGTCPAHITVLGGTSLDPFGLVCTYMTGMRFIVIGFAGVIATLIFIGRID